MAYYRQVRVILDGDDTITVNFDVNSYKGLDAYDSFVKKARNWPKTKRVEINETDTQLYAYPADKRTYQHSVYVGNKHWKFYGIGADAAYLQ